MTRIELDDDSAWKADVLLPLNYIPAYEWALHERGGGGLFQCPSDSSRIRTYDRLLRRQLLYPAELLSHR